MLKLRSETVHFNIDVEQPEYKYHHPLLGKYLLMSFTTDRRKRCHKTGGYIVYPLFIFNGGVTIYVNKQSNKNIVLCCTRKATVKGKPDTFERQRPDKHSFSTSQTQSAIYFVVVVEPADVLQGYTSTGSWKSLKV